MAIRCLNFKSFFVFLFFEIACVRFVGKGNNVLLEEGEGGGYLDFIDML